MERDMEGVDENEWVLKRVVKIEDETYVHALMANKDGSMRKDVMDMDDFIDEFGSHPLTEYFNQKKAKEQRQKPATVAKKAQAAPVMPIPSKKVSDFTSERLLPLHNTDEDGVVNFVLLMSGAFNPVHLNHVRLMDKAAEFMRYSFEGGGRVKVVGGFFIPSHDLSLKKKLGPTRENEWVSGYQRCQMLQQALDDDKKECLWEVDRWLCCSCADDANFGLRNAGERLKEKVRSFYGLSDSSKSPSLSQLRFVSVVGSDGLPRMGRALAAGDIVICVHDRDAGFDVAQFVEERRRDGAKLYLVDIRNEGRELSSTKVRQLVREEQWNALEQMLHPKVLQYIRDRNMRYGRDGLQKESKQDELDRVFQEESFAYASKIVKLSPFYDESGSDDWTPLNDEDMLGKGVTGSVFPARNSRNPSMRVAVKKVALFVKDREDKKGNSLSRRYRLKLKGIEHELDAAARLNHFGSDIRGVCNATSVFLNVKDQSVGFVMPLYKCSLQDFMSTFASKTKGPQGLDPQLALRILLDVAHGMSVVHKVGILHRDLHARNILIRSSSSSSSSSSSDHGNIQAAVCDFGLSVLEERSSTLMDDLRGAVRFYAPEAMVSKAVYLKASDVFSYAMLAATMLMGTEPWKEMSTMQVVEKVVERRERPRVPEVELIADVLRQCWEHDPRNRPTFAEIVEILEKKK